MNVANMPAVIEPPSSVDVRKMLAARCAEVDRRVHRAYTTAVRQHFPFGIALAAVGGFGRGELFPCSDVDLLLLVESETQMAAAKEAFSSFLQSLWDSGLRPSHSVQTVSYCVAEHEDNTELTISLLDRRLLAGDPAMFKWLDERFDAFLAKRGAAIAQSLARLAEARRAKFQNTIYHLEPNLKDAPGGLRDLQTTRWLAFLRRHESAKNLSAEFAALAALRIRLHELAGRDQNVLSFDAQEAMSEHPAFLMRGYYRQARIVDQAVKIALETALIKDGTLLDRFHQWRSNLSTPDFTVSHDRVLLRAPAQLRSNLSVFEFAARHRLHLAPDTLDRLAGFIPEAHWEDWKRLLSLPTPSVGLRAMQETGALPAALPEWRNIECLVVRDFYHRYTVDEHTLLAIAALESIADGRFRDLFAEISDPALVRFAILMHDLGKGSGVEHVAESLRIASMALARVGTPETDRADIEFLVARHLDLFTAMTSRDLNDGATAKALASRVGTVERLRQLAIMTYADLSAVNPEALTPWRLEQLWRVYLLTYAELTRSLFEERIHDASGVLFLEGLPVRYLRTHLPAEIDAHVELAKQLETRPVAVAIAHERGFYRLTLLTWDRAGLFAAVAGAISSFGLNILKVEAFSNAQGMAVDTFTFSDPHRTLELNPPEVDRLRAIVKRVVEGKQDVVQLLRGRPQPSLPSRGARLKPSVALSNEASATATLIEIVAEDRPGLLYDLASAISAAGCNIEVVLIDTEAHKALDVFYVTAGGGKLDDALEARLKTALLSAL